MDTRGGEPEKKPQAAGKGTAGLKAAVTGDKKPDPAPAAEIPKAQMTTKQIKLAIQVADTVDQVRELDGQIAGIPDDAEREELLTLQDSRIINLT